jgi:general secretion pathway protein J
LKSLPDANYKPLRHSGFTLIEALVAMALIAIIAVMSFQAVEVVMQADQRSRDKLSDETQLHRAWQIIHRDLMHLRNRTFKDGLGGTEAPYITDNSQFGVRFSRGGGPMVRNNPSGIRRIQYSLNEEQQLVRQSWGIAESPRYSDGVSQRILDNVAEVLFEHQDNDGNFVPSWPPIKGSSLVLPKMIRVSIRLTNNTETSRLFLGVTAK